MKKLMKVLIAMIALAVFFNACRKDDDVDSTPGSTSNDLVYATITGIVTDESNQPIIGVQVIAYGNVTTTDVNGIFVLKGDVAKKRCVLEFSRQGYMKRFHAIIPSSAVNYVNIMLQGEPFSQSIMTGNGGTVNLGSAGSVAFPANAFVINGTTTPYIGEVKVYTNHLSPDNQNFPMLTPGGDLSGVNTNGAEVTLYSFGMANVTLKGTSGEDLQLAPGTNATITFPVAASQTSTAPQSIPLWSLDETDALWKEEGQAIRVGNNYVGIVSHFTWWNCDAAGPRATIVGRVVDCEGIPLANVTVTVNGQMTLVTDQDGFYTNWVPSGITLTFVVLHQGVFLPSQTETITNTIGGQPYTVPDLVVPCGAKISGNLTGCNSELISGNVVLKLNDQIINNLYTADGSFNINCFENSTVTLVAASATGMAVQTVTTSSQNSTIDIGTMMLCNSASIGSNSFVLDGAGYSNLPVNISTYTSNFGNCYFDRSTCGLTGSSSIFGAGCSISINFPGMNTVSADLSDYLNSYFYMEIYLPSIGSLTPAKGSNYHFMFDVTEVGNVGDSIKGSFYGDMKFGVDSELVFVSNGHFAFIRTQ